MVEREVRETEKEEGRVQEKTLVDQANEAAERLEKANERHAELLRQQEELEAKMKLGGRSIIPEKREEPKEESPEEYAQNALRGKINEKNSS